MNGALWASTIVDAIGACVLVVALGRLRRAPAAALAALAVALWLGKLAVLRRGGPLDTFGVVHALFLDGALVAPLAAVVALALGRARALAVLALSLGVLAAYAALLEPRRLEVTRTAVALGGDAREAGGPRGPLRLVVLADLQTEHPGAYERGVVRRALALRPDLILLPGDLHQGSEGTLAAELGAMRALLRPLGATGRALFVPGDQEDPGEARRVLAGTGVRLLEDDVAVRAVRGRRVALGGLRVDYAGAPARAAVARLERTPADLRVLLAHRPDAAARLRPGSPVDLVVAGHTHGGQVRLPLVGAPFTASDLPRRVGEGGLHRVAGHRLYVSRGIGMERGQAPRVRFGVRPELALLLVG